MTEWPSVVEGKEVERVDEEKNLILNPRHECVCVSLVANQITSPRRRFAQLVEKKVKKYQNDPTWMVKNANASRMRADVDGNRLHISQQKAKFGSVFFVTHTHTVGTGRITKEKWAVILLLLFCCNTDRRTNRWRRRRSFVPYLAKWDNNFDVVLLIEPIFGLPGRYTRARYLPKRWGEGGTVKNMRWPKLKPKKISSHSFVLITFTFFASEIN